MSASFHAASNSRCTHSASAALFCFARLSRSPKSDRALRGCLDEIFAEHPLGLRGFAAEEQRRAERLAQRIEEDRRLVVRQRVRRGDGARPEPDRTRPALRAPRRCAHRAPVAASARMFFALSRPVPPKSAPSGIFVDALASAVRSFAASSGFARASQRDAPREVPPRHFHRMIRRRLVRARESRRGGRSAAAPRSSS